MFSVCTCTDAADARAGLRAGPGRAVENLIRRHEETEREARVIQERSKVGSAGVSEVQAGYSDNTD